MIFPIPCRLWILALISAALPASAELQGGGLEGGSGLNGGGLQGGSLQTGRLQGGDLKSSNLRGANLQSAKPQEGSKKLNPATLKCKATELTKGGLGAQQLQGAVSTIPRTQVGALLFDVANVLMIQDPGMKDVAVGYLMAVLADPLGERHDDALAQLKQIFLDPKLEHSEAVRLYDSGLGTMKSLVEIKIGLTDEGRRSGLLTLQEVKAIYHHRRKQKFDEQPEDADMPKETEEEGSAEMPVETEP